MRSPMSRALRPLTAAVLAAVFLAGCASGPSDFLPVASNEAPQKSMVRDPSQQAALAAALAAQSRGDRMPSDDTSTMMALSVARQQQTEEAQALLRETEVAFNPVKAPACDPYSVDPAAACPAPSEPKTP